MRQVLKKRAKFLEKIAALIAATGYDLIERTIAETAIEDVCSRSAHRPFS